jgi:hypothetical protein
VTTKYAVSTCALRSHIRFDSATIVQELREQSANRHGIIAAADVIQKRFSIAPRPLSYRKMTLSYMPTFSRTAFMFSRNVVEILCRARRLCTGVWPSATNRLARSHHAKQFPITAMLLVGDETKCA